eukprot:2375267-Prymnesium_polylepis.1
MKERLCRWYDKAARAADVGPAWRGRAARARRAQARVAASAGAGWARVWGSNAQRARRARWRADGAGAATGRTSRASRRAGVCRR